MEHCTAPGLLILRLSLHLTHARARARAHVRDLVSRDLSRCSSPSSSPWSAVWQTHRYDLKVQLCHEFEFEFCCACGHSEGMEGR